MYQNITLKKHLKFATKNFFLFAFMLVISFSLKAQSYVNGNLGTGTVNKAGVTAPAGITWHEMQNNFGDNTTANSALAFDCSQPTGGTTNFSVSDNFVVPAGQTWTISGMSVYTIQTAASTPTAMGIVIRNGSPAVAGSTIVFGNLATNVYSSSAATNVNIITSSANPTIAPFPATLPVTEQKAVFSTTLTAGTYWVEWKIIAPTRTFNAFSQIFGARTQPGYNAVINNAGTWGALTDAGTPTGTTPVPVDLCFKINYTTTGGTACAAPTPGNTISTLATVCPGLPFNLSLQNATLGTGVTHQWQTATTPAGPWTNIVGATSANLGYSLDVTTSYRCNVTCGATTVPSTPVSITKSTSCYCASGATSAADEEIFNVTVGTLNNTSTCTSVGPGPGSVNSFYSNYTSGVGAPSAPDLLRGVGNPFSVQIGTCGGNWANSLAIWIDLNQDGVFATTERVYVSGGTTTGAHFETGNLVIPATALTGLTRMRVVSVETAPANITPCGTYTWGETEDYNVNIVTCASVGITTQPTNVTADCNTSATFKIVTTGPAFTYQWQSRVSATSPWVTVVNNATYSGATTSTLLVSNLTPTLNGYQYRVIYNNPCIATDFSSVGTLTVGPLVVTTSPTSAVICQVGGIQQISISNAPTLLSGNVTVNSSFATPIAIPDAPTLGLPTNPVVLAGINNTLAVSGASIPAGATITGVNVRLSGTHTYLGDLVMSLKAPNGKIINLDYFLNNTGIAGSTTAFTNTVITSNLTAPRLNTGTGTFTNTFRADLVPGAGTPLFAPMLAGPTGFVPNETDFAQLYSPATAATINGNWTLGIYDGGGTDAGNLNNWSITINYTYLGFPVGVFTGAAGTMFTDALATVPYTGTDVNSIYVKPTASGIYTATVSLASGCTGSASIPVTVNRPVAGTATLVNNSLCENKNTSFVLGGTLTGGPTFNHQFQVKTSATAAWVNVVNGGVYSGATTTTLTLTNVPFSFNGYQFRDSISSLGCGFLISTVGTLTVSPNTNPQVVISAAPIRSLFPGLTSTLTAAVSSATAPITYQWMRNGINLLGATTNRTVVGIDGLGVYSVMGVDANGCTFTSLTNVTSEPSIPIVDSVISKNRLFIYPSPNNGLFEVRYFNEGKAASAVNVFDEKGALVLSQQFSANTAYQSMKVNMTGYGKGIYRVDVLSSNGSRISTGSVLVY